MAQASQIGGPPQISVSAPFTTLRIATGAATSTPATSSVSTSKDSTRVSEFAASLTGRAAKAFAYLDPKSKEILATAVSSRRISAEEAGIVLRKLGEDALFQRYQRERTLTAGQLEAQAEARIAAERLNAIQYEIADVKAQLTATREAFSRRINLKPGESYTQTDVDPETAQLNALFARSDELGKAREEAYDYWRRTAFQSTFADIKNFSSIKLDEDDTLNDGTPYLAQDTFEIFGKLPAEFNPSLYGNAFQRFAADFDLPGFGKAAPLSQQLGSQYVGRQPSPEPDASAPARPVVPGILSGSAASAAEVAAAAEDPATRLASRLSDLVRGGTGLSGDQTRSAVGTVFGLLQEALTVRDGPAKARSVVASLQADLARGDDALQASLKGLVDLLNRSREKASREKAAAE